MNAAVERVFEDKPAVREATPLFVGLFSPTGAGKTYSALRLATGIQRIAGGDIFGVDTESKRMLHYADKFKFRHVQFAAPFSPNDYQAVVDHCIARGAKTIIIDSMSHEHTGIGGVLEWHAQETERLAKLWGVSEEKAQMSAWKAPKEARARFIDRLLQVNINFVFCFRAKEKLSIRPGKPPLDLGYMPLGAEELFYEMTLGALLLPMGKGVPVWTSDMPGEKAMMKLPEQFEKLFGTPKQLDEDTGQKLAEWAAGSGGMPPADIDKHVELMMNSTTLPELQAAFDGANKAAKPFADLAAQKRFVAVKDSVKARLQTGATA
jgi:hypothetical protein